MKMFIPALKTKLQVTKDWHISLFCERRNKTLWDHAAEGRVPMDQIPWQHRPGQMALVIVPEGSCLSVERIFIRKDQEGYNSVTLRGWVEHNGVSKNVRFWVVLDTFNNMHAEVIK